MSGVVRRRTWTCGGGDCRKNGCSYETSVEAARCPKRPAPKEHIAYICEAGCSHRTESAALNCKARWAVIAPKDAGVCLSRRDSLAKSRRFRVAAMRNEGKTYKEIGAAFGVSANRAMQLFKQHERNCRRDLSVANQKTLSFLSMLREINAKGQTDKFLDFLEATQ